MENTSAPTASPTPAIAFLPFLATDAEQKLFGIFIFIVAGLFEIGGGWLVWQTMRESRYWWFALIGALVLVGYGFAATLQPITNFAQVYAIYGAFFIIMSLLWGYFVDDFKPDLGDYIGTSCILIGTGLMYFWN